MLKIGIVGCGAIATFISKAIARKKVSNAKVVAYYDKNRHKAEKLSKITNADVCDSIDELVKKDIDLVVEAASIKAVEEVATKALSNNKDVLVMSVGAFVDKELFLKLYNLAKDKGRKIYLPSGAIAGIDAIKSLTFGKIEEVVLKTTKPVEGLKEALKDKGIDADAIKEPTVVFEGDVFDAIKQFPSNINVSVMLSIASEFPAKVIIVADPNAKTNNHEIFVKSSIGTLKVLIENVPCEENPKTSALAAYSAIRIIKDISEPIKIGT
ncbi:aspartate dehydrogenase [Methanotorris igneus]|uniref:L-aspartate dehydrogenase n=1 Tax=Methanotorris igneus (strain DSM 5666 / JCM 11834 / Kol 5) TaxID=880724 RepID=F6BB81_METIK|nr:aspartate dehydrogenase [Methanotorris igneus]AEF95966.1 L-aspartate dehydrogenase [Methanotorris igneus Kol 5]